MPNKEQLINLIASAPLPQKIAVVVAAVLLIGGLYYQMWYSDLVLEEEKIDKAIAEANSAIETKRKIVGKLPEYQAQKQLLENQLTLATKKLPSEREIPELLTNLARLAEQCGLQLRKFELKGEKVQNFYAEVPVEMEVVGAYHDLTHFFYKLSRQETVRRIVNISDLELQSPKVTNLRVELKASFKATTYRYLGERGGPARTVVKK